MFSSLVEFNNAFNTIRFCESKTVEKLRKAYVRANEDFARLQIYSKMQQIATEKRRERPTRQAWKWQIWEKDRERNELHMYQIKS